MYNVDQISRETKCLKSYVSKGISLACYVQALCLDLGKGVDKSSHEAKKYYKRVFLIFYYIINLVIYAMTF